MKRISVFAVAASLLAVCSCSNKMESPAGQIEPGGARLTAYTESRESRTSVVDGGTEVFWNTEDEIKVFSGESSGKFVSLNSELSLSAEFAGPSGFSFKSGEDIAAVYPYSEDATWDGEAFTLTLPSEQVACPGTFAKGMNIAVAKSKDSHALQFRNVGGGVRFSVKEEGITKVIFEGLDGEMIAGKVKIGFEDGIPVVREVTDGRLFITLTAPDGASFEVGKWYYIVAIPGALDKGFKLRFYKEDTYARLTSENAVQVKRSIFGSIAGADVDAESVIVSSSFPETEKEIGQAFGIIDDIAPITKKIIDTYQGQNINFDILAEEFTKIDGVSQVKVSESGNISLKTMSDVYVNVIVDYQNDMFGGIDRELSGEPNNSCLDRFVLSNCDYSKSKVCTVMPKGKKAIMLMPVIQETIDKLSASSSEPGLIPGYVNAFYDEKENFLKNAGYEVDRYDNSEATVQLFLGDNLEQYDIVYINTHGACDLKTHDGQITTGLKTPTKVPNTYNNETLLDKLFNRIAFGDLSTCIIDGAAYFYMTTKAIESSDPKFNNTWFFAHACYSAAETDMSSAVLSRGAYAYNGFTDTAAMWESNFVASYMILAFASGMEFSSANEWTKHNARDYIYGFDTSRDRNLFYGRRANVDTFYIVNPTPTNLQSSVNGNDVSFTWNIPQTAGTYEYRVAIDGELLGKRVGEDYINRTSATYSTTKGGDHKWYVQADLFIDGEKVTSFKSEEKTFNIEGGGGDETVLSSRTYGGKTYSILRKNESTNDYRTNGDGSKFYSCTFSVKVGSTTYDIPGTFYSYQKDREDKDLGPALAVDKSSGDMWLFLLEKDADKYYGMSGYIIKISSGSFSKTTVFSQANFGWYPYFSHDSCSGSLVLNSFSFAGYFSLISFEDEDWALYGSCDISPEDFKALQAQNEIIYIF